MAVPRPETRPHRGNPAFGRALTVEAEEDALEASSLVRDLYGLEVEERQAQRDLREAEEASGRLRAENHRAEAESARHLRALVDGLRHLCSELPPGYAATRAWGLFRQGEQVLEMEARSLDLRRRIELREDESRKHRHRLSALTGDELVLARAAIEQLRTVARAIVSIDARGAHVRAGRDINIGGGA